MSRSTSQTSGSDRFQDPAKRRASSRIESMLPSRDSRISVRASSLAAASSANDVIPASVSRPAKTGPIPLTSVRSSALATGGAPAGSPDAATAPGSSAGVGRAGVGGVRNAGGSGSFGTVSDTKRSRTAQTITPMPAMIPRIRANRFMLGKASDRDGSGIPTMGRGVPVRPTAALVHQPRCHPDVGSWVEDVGSGKACGRRTLRPETRYVLEEPGRT